MSIKDDWNRGTKFEKHFDNLGEKARPLIGKPRRIAIYEVDDTGLLDDNYLCRFRGRKRQL